MLVCLGVESVRNIHVLPLMTLLKGNGETYTVHFGFFNSYTSCTALSIYIDGNEIRESYVQTSVMLVLIDCKDCKAMLLSSVM